MSDNKTFIDSYAENNVEGRKNHPTVHAVALALTPGLQLAEDAFCDNHVKKLEEQRERGAAAKTR
jgi:hypothetical protein